MSAPVAPSTPQDDALSGTGCVLLALLTVFWGLNGPFMKWGLNEVRPWSMRSFCIPIGLIIMALTITRGPRLPGKGGR